MSEATRIAALGSSHAGGPTQRSVGLVGAGWRMVRTQAMGNWNFADIWEVVADELPDAPCLIHGDDRRTWSEVDRRADGVAQLLLDAGLERQQAVAQYLYNSNEYMESMYAAFKGAFVPVNTNYRYTADELLYLWDNADAGAVVFHGSFADTIDAIRERLPKVKLWLWVDDAGGACPQWATPYEEAATSGSSRVAPAWGRSGDDLNFLYTGGTTGMPKGVMWRQDDLAVVLTATAASPLTDDAHARRRPRHTDPARCPIPAGLPADARHRQLPGPRHAVRRGQHRHARPVATSTRPNSSTRSNARASRRSPSSATAFAKPILRALDAEPDRWDLSSLVGDRLVRRDVEPGDQDPPARAPSRHGADGRVLVVGGAGDGLVDLGGRSDGRDRQVPAEPRHDRDRRPQPSAGAGSGEIGRLAVGGRQPVGYYKDPEKSARTFFEVDGKRYSCPGDFATIDADGRITLLGRGSQCINTGGEKVFPEEVEEAMKTHPDVLDAVAVGVPDEKFGEAVTGMVEARPGHTIDAAAVIASRQDDARRLQGTEAHRGRRHDRAAPPTARSTTSVCGPRPPSRSASADERRYRRIAGTVGTMSEHVVRITYCVP